MSVTINPESAEASEMQTVVLINQFMLIYLFQKFLIDCFFTSFVKLAHFLSVLYS